ncbi:MAG: chemotaxis protein CheA, partial [Ktedonobacterales bacterium]|nr:chemotaxis protein CheA [Ktedonobacterales bacterium]
LDALMNLVGELVIDRTRLARISAKLAAHSNDPVLAEELTETSRHLARISDDLQDEVMRSRMLPIESVFSKFPRLVRDLAQKVSKKIDFIVEGKDTELDRSVAEQIGDPIIHLLRNSIDHGVEPGAERLKVGKDEAGQVRLAARHEENQIVIDIEDDGRGINAEFIKQKAVTKGIITAEAAARMGQREALELIFASGFSTAEQISDISGRGVGMDIVRTNVERLNGTVTVETEIGQGTRFTVRLPLTLAIIRALLIDVGGQTYAIPLTSVVEALRIEREKLRSVNGREAIELRGQVLPLLRLREIFESFSHDTPPVTAQETERPDRQFVVAVRWGERRGGLIVDALIGEQEIVIKPLGTLFRSAQGVSGGAVLGDGQVAPILDVAALIKHIMASERGVRAPQGATV